MSSDIARSVKCENWNQVLTKFLSNPKYDSERRSNSRNWCFHHTFRTKTLTWKHSVNELTNCLISHNKFVPYMVALEVSKNPYTALKTFSESLKLFLRPFLDMESCLSWAEYTVNVLLSPWDLWILWEKSYKCNQCQFPSCKWSNLVDHMKGHTGENTLSCCYLRILGSWLRIAIPADCWWIIRTLARS